MDIGWHDDPSDRFDFRFFDGRAWTRHVAKDGQRFEDSEPPAPGQPTPQGFCRSCGVESSPEAKFCGRCGVAMQPGAAANHGVEIAHVAPSGSVRVRRTTVVVLTLLVVVVVGASVAGWSFVRSRADGGSHTITGTMTLRDDKFDSYRTASTCEGSIRQAVPCPAIGAFGDVARRCH